MKSIAIVGGGVIGLCAAHYCRERGFRVTVIDRGPAGGDGCSFGNAGMVVPSHVIPLAAPGMVRMGLKWMGDPESPFYVKPRLSRDLWSWGWKFWRACSRRRVERAAPLLRDLHQASCGCYEALDELLDHRFGLTRAGLLMLCSTQQGLDEEIHAGEFARSLGIPAEILDAAQVSALEPDVRMNVLGGVFFPRDCHLTPPRLMAALREHLERQGCEFVWEAEVKEFERAGRRIVQVRTSRGDFPADEFVLAGGAWSPELVRDVGLRLPMQAGKGYSLTLPSPRQTLHRGAILTEARVAVTPMGTSLRFGGTMELAGMSRDVNPARVRGLVKSVLAHFPDFRADDFAEVKPWCGLRPCTPDGLPYVGRTRRCDNLLLAAGHAMLGVSLGPITGKLISQLAAEEPPEMPIELLSPDRYG